MKREVMRRSLFLKKETVARLSHVEMRNLRVGCTTETIGLECKAEVDYDYEKPGTNTC